MKGVTGIHRFSSKSRGSAGYNAWFSTECVQAVAGGSLSVSLCVPGCCMLVFRGHLFCPFPVLSVGRAPDSGEMFISAKIHGKSGKEVHWIPVPLVNPIATWWPLLVYKGFGRGDL